MSYLCFLFIVDGGVLQEGSCLITQIRHEPSYRTPPSIINKKTQIRHEPSYRTPPSTMNKKNT
jgi:hypothetical protein